MDFGQVRTEYSDGALFIINYFFQLFPCRSGRSSINIIINIPHPENRYSPVSFRDSKRLSFCRIYVSNRSCVDVCSETQTLSSYIHILSCQRTIK